uniref:Uncharacterized protein n=1 Tax=Anguilla anguilla TaxID=7936 RepID=A0A0E9XD32_ANGAN
MIWSITGRFPPNTRSSSMHNLIICRPIQQQTARTLPTKSSQNHFNSAALHVSSLA